MKSQNKTNPKLQNASKLKEQKQQVIQEQTDEELEDNIEEEDDDKINDSLFSMYDSLFKNFNDFGSMFQKTAHYIGMLIRKNMQLNQKLELYEEQFDKFIQINKRNEEAYENLLKSLVEKDKLIEDLLGENTGFKLQLEQFIVKKPVSAPQRDILKEREEAAKKSSSTSTSSNKQQQQQQKPINQQQVERGKNSSNNVIPGTFESFFDFDRQANNQENDSCSLKDLFSMKNTKKRTAKEISNNEESKEEQWLSNKRKNKRSYKEDNHIADRFDQLSQAFLNVGNSNSNSFKGRESIESLAQLAGLGANYQEDSGSSSSVINAGIRFDAQSAKDNMVQSKLNFNKDGSKGAQKRPSEKRFEIQMVEQVSDSLVDDFFSIKNEKKERGSAQSNAKSSTSGGNRQKSGKIKEK